MSWAIQARRPNAPTANRNDGTCAFRVPSHKAHRPRHPRPAPATRQTSPSVHPLPELGSLRHRDWRGQMRMARRVWPSRPAPLASIRARAGFGGFGRAGAAVHRRQARRQQRNAGSGGSALSSAIHTHNGRVISLPRDPIPVQSWEAAARAEQSRSRNRVSSRLFELVTLCTQMESWAGVNARARGDRQTSNLAGQVQETAGNGL